MFLVGFFRYSVWSLVVRVSLDENKVPKDDVLGAHHVADIEAKQATPACIQAVLEDLGLLIPYCEEDGDDPCDKATITKNSDGSWTVDSQDRMYELRPLQW